VELFFCQQQFISVTTIVLSARFAFLRRSKSGVQLLGLTITIKKLEWPFLFAVEVPKSATVDLFRVGRDDSSGGILNRFSGSLALGGFFDMRIA
jgi:hypothetical protein